MKVYGMTVVALMAFAANSVLCRLALGAEVIDAASFTTLRLVSGAAMLFGLLGIQSWLKRKETPTFTMNRGKGSWSGGVTLFIYALGFSYAYMSLDTGTGALILFGMVQFTIIAVELSRGNRFALMEWVGALVAFSGFVYLVLPTLSTPSFIGFLQMAIAGIAWGAYTLIGKGSTRPLNDTAYNFVRTLPMALVWTAFSLGDMRLSYAGIGFAVLSGALASGVGYAVWYAVLRYIAPFRASVLQLSVPIIAAIGGVIWASEVLGLRLMLSGVCILGGVLLVLTSKQKNRHV